MNEFLNEIRELTILSLFSDDELMDILVLKGGNALELSYELNSRASMDIDVSMSKDFSDFGLTVKDVEEKLEYQLNQIFSEKDYTVFDIKLEERPKQKRTVDDLNWGGYVVKFKVIDSSKYEHIGEDNIDKLRRSSLSVTETDKKVVQVDISKYEFTQPSEEREFHDYIIKVYSPRMIIFEKLRAICQQMTEYTDIVKTSQSPRPRDFYDIYTVKENLEPSLNLNDSDNQQMVKDFFKIKKVPLHLIEKIKDPLVRDFHESGFASLKDTVIDNDNLMPFEFYYDYVVQLVDELKPVWSYASNSSG
ncbi:Nucleotidyl transferase AbiEii toxin, Type IV TA system [Pelagirhabdus alkalitolerans]|uniref:Nucleotidyl transferase AbiEii toxin, Type IV TA system n=1 Tax=Pelagirhabdus alkalitolerans TaxID=1612202 RepID=A0A1G6MXV4_9BACI|nr:nucleotidyl transferase AbiEii/AbiGii toxin family protein [Pelagirhabdus alkalitolerans]SDC60400.1 Nucleotidyl transferase AbiEii toxin, Type IV TA system [Pelagirhabdus alkalitolerans]